MVQPFVWPYKQPSLLVAVSNKELCLSSTPMSVYCAQPPKESLSLITHTCLLVHSLLCLQTFTYPAFPSCDILLPALHPQLWIACHLYSQGDLKFRLQGPFSISTFLICLLAFLWATGKSHIPLFYITVLYGQICCLYRLIQYLKTLQYFSFFDCPTVSGMRSITRQPPQHIFTEFTLLEHCYATSILAESDQSHSCHSDAPFFCPTLVQSGRLQGCKWRGWRESKCWNEGLQFLRQWKGVNRSKAKRTLNDQNTSWQFPYKDT